MSADAVHLTHVHPFDAAPGAICDGCGKARDAGGPNAFRLSGYAYCRACWDRIVRDRARTWPSLRWKVAAGPLVEINGPHSVIVMPDAADYVIATEARFARKDDD